MHRVRCWVSVLGHLDHHEGAGETPWNAAWEPTYRLDPPWMAVAHAFLGAPILDDQVLGPATAA